MRVNHMLSRTIAIVVLACGIGTVVAGCGGGSPRTRQSSSNARSVSDAYRKMHEAGRKAGYSDREIDDLATKVIEANR